MLEQVTTMWWGLVLLGLAAGILSGALGLGSGLILIPIMVLLFGFAQKSAQGTALAVMVPMALLGAFRYWKNPQIEINLAVVGLIAAGALVGVIIGTELAGRLPGLTLRKVFGVYLLIIGLKTLIASPRPTMPGAEQTMDLQKIELIEKGSASGDAGNTGKE